MNRRLKAALQGATAGLASAALLLALCVLALDALEYEHTGECRDCLILNKIKGI